MLILTITFIVVIWLTNIIFDMIWSRGNSIPVTNLDDIYNIPVEYNNITNINLKLSADDKLAIEGNKKFKIIGSNKNYSYYDSAAVTYPVNTNDHTNKIFLKFEDSNDIDSIAFVISKSESPKLFWKQIFLSSVTVASLNEFSKDTGAFRIKPGNLVDSALLSNNDTLINSAFNYFNVNKDNLHLAECGTNCLIFKSICDKYNLPTRIISLQGGDAYFTGLNSSIGYPLHVVCEVYSSKGKKWYVIDPTYGFRYREKNSSEFMNAVEISDKYFFNAEKDIIQDSVLFTKGNLLRRDYFKFYENAFYKNNLDLNFFSVKFLQYFFNKFNYKSQHYTNSLLPTKNGYYYLSLKSILYIIISLIYFNLVLFLITKRLFSVKKPLNRTK